MKKFLLLLFICFDLLSAQTNNYTNPLVKQSVKFDKTAPLRTLKKVLPGERIRNWKEKGVPNKESIRKFESKELNPLRVGPDEVWQNKMGSIESVTPVNNWEGIDNIGGVYPPDTQGDVGLNHYIQMVNLSFQIWDKQGNSLYGPVDNSTLWDGFGDPWDGTNDGDPIVLYDEQADRWILTQFALPEDGRNFILIAITETGDPTGAWYRYGFEFTAMPDYPKFGVWNDGYYMTVNSFANRSTYDGVGVAVFERDKMLNGDPTATMQFFDLLPDDDPYSMLPADFDGTPPPPGTPNYLLYMNDDAFSPNYLKDHLRIWECGIDWSNSSNSYLMQIDSLETASFDYQFNSNTPSQLANVYGNRSNIRQPNAITTVGRWTWDVGLDALSSRVMFRLQYRNFGDYQAMVTNHTVDVDGTDRAGVRWYELRNYGSGWSIYQQGTYSPDTDGRWMGSVAMDEYGNIALGYSVSSSTTYPSIRYTGRRKTDPLGTMSIAEQSIIAGTGSQTGAASRWGDYSMMSVDPADNTTFWYTTEYVETSGGAPWQTRIASFTFGAKLNLKVYLQGSFNVNSMTTDLNTNGKLPAINPYSDTPFNFAGADRVSLVDEDNNNVPDFFENHTDIVDWVMVELRTGTSASSAVSKKTGFVKSDGTVVGLDGVSPLLFGVPSGSYYIVVLHRNHLPIMSAGAVTMSNTTPAAYDFTTGSDKYYGTGGSVQLN
ncbi:MAG: hypothetical protein KDC90_10330 [Ignavibacteriae bacterium]|nr:hypothetical protein [Ignavibacteriota bacterium]